MIRRAWFWVLLLLVMTLLANSLLPYQSQWVETYYSRGFFMVFRSCWDFLLGWSPLPLIYFLIGAIVLALAVPLFRKYGWRQKLLIVARRLGLMMALLVIAFYWMWGFNYKRIDIGQTLDIRDVDISVEDIFDTYCQVSDTLTALRSMISSDIKWDGYQVDQDELRGDLMKIYGFLDLKTWGRVRIRRLYPRGSLLYIGTAGVYLPFVGEGHIDPGLHPLTHPFTMMHEMSHGYGWTGEDVCNFLALLASINSEDPITRYSGYMSYWRYLRSNAYRTDGERWRSMGVLVSEDVLRDYHEILAYSDQYPDIMPRLRDLIYDSYLKSHGISEGIVSYSAMVSLAHGWQVQYGSLILEDIGHTQGQ